MSSILNLPNIESELNVSVVKKGKILKFLYTYSKGADLYIDDIESFNSGDNIPYSMMNFMWAVPESFTADKDNSKMQVNFQRICKDVSKYYLKLIDNQWIICPVKDKFPIPIVNWHHSLLPEYIRFANATSICYINTDGHKDNFGH